MAGISPIAFYNAVTATQREIGYCYLLEVADTLGLTTSNVGSYIARWGRNGWLRRIPVERPGSGRPSYRIEFTESPLPEGDAGGGSPVNLPVQLAGVSHDAPAPVGEG